MRFYGPDFAVCAVVWSDGRTNRRTESALCPHRGDQRGDADDVDDAFEIGGQHVQSHFPAERMLDCLAALAHLFWVLVEALLAGFENMFLFPAGTQLT